MKEDFGYFLFAVFIVFVTIASLRPSQIEKDIAIIKTVLIMKGIAPEEVFQESKKK